MSINYLNYLEIVISLRNIPIPPSKNSKPGFLLSYLKKSVRPFSKFNSMCNPKSNHKHVTSINEERDEIIDYN